MSNPYAKVILKRPKLRLQNHQIGGHSLKEIAGVEVRLDHAAASQRRRVWVSCNVLSPHATDPQNPAGLSPADHRTSVAKSAMVAATITFVLLPSSTAMAATRPLPGDPRVCGSTDKAACALANARQAARKHVGGPGGMFQGPSSCQRVSRYTFTFGCQLGTSSYIVRFKKGTTRWTVAVTP